MRRVFRQREEQRGAAGEGLGIGADGGGDPLAEGSRSLALPPAHFTIGLAIDTRYMSVHGAVHVPVPASFEALLQ